MIDAAEIVEKLKSAFAGAIVEVRDTTGGGDHFEALIVSATFEGRSRVDQHRLVYAALGDAMKQQIHALGLKTYTPEAWVKMQKG